MKKKLKEKKEGPKERTFFKESWLILKKNKILFVPNLLILIINLILFSLFVWFTDLGKIFLENDYLFFKHYFFSSKFLISFFVYVVLVLFLDNFFLASKYGLIKQIISKNKGDLISAFKFGKRFYWATLGIHVLSYLIIFVPLLLLAIFLFLVLPLSPLVSFTVFFPLVVAWLVYITLRLLFVYPTMAFEKKGAYSSLKEDFHYVKTHLHHTFLTWLIVCFVLLIFSIIKINLEQMTLLLYQELFFLGFLGIGVIFLIEILVSVWEHVFIFRNYLALKKSRKSRKRRRR